MLKATLYVSQSRVALPGLFVNTFFQKITEKLNGFFGTTFPRCVDLPRLFFACFGEARAIPSPG